ncbi:MAG: DUF4352 domain-containing protein [Clostridia bacterium]|nr:DUF4352 domain-containing protein [Clostridia bacterium]
MKNKNLRSIVITLLAVLYVAMLASCSDALEKKQEQTSPVMQEVYSDNVISVDAGELVTLDSPNEGTSYCYLKLRIHNDSLSSIAFSGVLCVNVTTADGAACPVDNISDGYAAAEANLPDFSRLDGMIAQGDCMEGYIFFEAPSGSSSYHVSLATDFAADEWVEFGYSAS